MSQPVATFCATYAGGLHEAMCRDPSDGDDTDKHDVPLGSLPVSPPDFSATLPSFLLCSLPTLLFLHGFRQALPPPSLASPYLRQAAALGVTASSRVPSCLLATVAAARRRNPRVRSRADGGGGSASRRASKPRAGSVGGIKGIHVFLWSSLRCDRSSFSCPIRWSLSHSYCRN